MELQAILLMESIQNFLSNVDAWFYSPRTSRKPSYRCQKILQSLGAFLNLDDLNIEHDFLPQCNGIYASSHLESLNRYDSILLVDTDTVFLQPVPSKMFDSPYIYMRAVDNKGVGSEGESDPLDSFWKDLFLYFKLPLPQSILSTTVRIKKIRPYYNSGFVLANDSFFFRQWLKDFRKVMASGIRPKTYKSRYHDDFSFMEQVVLSVTAQRFSHLVKLASNQINYPVPFHSYLKSQSRHVPLWEVIHMHYHKWFNHPRFLESSFDDKEKISDAFRWLQERLPLRPTISGPLKNE